MIFQFRFLICVVSFIAVGGQNENCTSEPCKNEAICEDTVDGYQCYCKDGYAGENCDIDFNDCISQPCNNNATCIDGVATYSCLCTSGFTGNNCQTNIDECASSPCIKNSTCIDMVNSYVCQCMPPFRGENCSVLPCDTTPCANEAVCGNDLSFNESAIGFVCECVSGFTGSRCEINIEDCDLDNFTSCFGNGICVDGINAFSCLCEPGWVGDRCQSPIDDCIGNSCKNNATCIDRHLGYDCRCGRGYGGALCERQIDECSTLIPCANEATCVDMFNGYRCECASGWYGENCTEEVNECDTNPCYNSADCIDIIDGFVCRCPPFYTGLLCETQFNPCAPEYNQCQNGANCVVPPDGQYRCYCPAGLTGTQCEVNTDECLSTPCHNNGTCEDIINGYICHCGFGWSGKNCGLDIDECASNPCLNDADCQDRLNGFECNCTREYQGRICEETIDFCLQQPCHNNGECVRLFGGFECICLPPFTGELCSGLIDACSSNPCDNNGTCMNTERGFVCNCLSPFTGPTCTSQIDFCESDPCFNEGTCLSLVDDFYCACQEYLTGKQCTDFSDFCVDFPCKNDANCISGEFEYRCVCAYGFIGESCEVMIDFCADYPCLNSANCTNIPGGFVCHCPKEFTGDLCQNIAPPAETSSGLLSSTLVTSAASLPYSKSYSITFSHFQPYESPTFSKTTSTFSITTFVSVPPASLYSMSTPSSLQYSLATESEATMKGTTLKFDTSYISTFVLPSTTYDKTPLSSELITVKTTNTIYVDQTLYSSEYILPSKSSNIINRTSRSFEPLSHSSFISYSTTSTDSILTPFSKSTLSHLSDSIQLVNISISTFAVSSSTLTFSDSLSKGSLVSPTALLSSFFELATSTITLPITVSLYSTSPTTLPISSATNSAMSPTSLILSETPVSDISNEVESTPVSYSTFFTATLSAADISLLLSHSLSSSDRMPTTSLSAHQMTSQYMHSSDRIIIMSSYKSGTLPLTTSQVVTSVFVSVVSEFSFSMTVYGSKSISSEISVLTKSPSVLPSMPLNASVSLSPSAVSSFHSSSIEVIAPHNTIESPEYTLLLTTKTISSESKTFTSDISEQLSPLLTTSNIYFQTSSDFSVSLLSLTYYITPSLSTYISSSANPVSLSNQDLSLTIPFSQSETSSISRSFMPATTVETSLSSGSVYSTDDTSASTTTQSEEINTSDINISPSYSISISELSVSTERGTLYTSIATSLIGTLSLSTSFVPTSYIHTISSVKHSSNQLLTSSYSIYTLPNSIFPSGEINPTTHDSSFTLSSSLVGSSHSTDNILSSSSIDILESSYTLPSSMSTYTESLVYPTTPESLNVDTVVSTDVEVSDLSSVKSTYVVHASSSKTFESSSKEISEFYSSSTQLISSSDNIAISSNDGSSFDSTKKYSTFTHDSTLPSPVIQTDSDSSIKYIILPSFTSSFTHSSVLQTSSVVSSNRFSLSSSLSSTIHVTSPFSSAPFLTSKSTPLETTLILTESVTLSTNTPSIISNTTPTSSSSSIIAISFFPDYTSTSSLTTTSTASASTSAITTVPATTTLPHPSCGTFICRNGGLCREDYLGVYCDCVPDFIGKNCETETNICNNHECENGGVCSVVVTRYGNPVPTCYCIMPFTGTRCENEKLIYYPAFRGNSYLVFTPPTISLGQSNEIYISVKTTQEDGSILFATNQNQDNSDVAFIHLYLTNGELRYKYSCDGLSIDVIHTNVFVNTGDIYDVIIRQVWSEGVGDWCSAVVITNEIVAVGKRMLSLRQPRNIETIYIGGIPRVSYQTNNDGFIHIMEGFVGCVHNFQINQREIDLVSMAMEAINIDNCNVRVCAHNPCKNDATCHSSDEEWYCDCLPGYGGALCERKLCDVNPCYHGGTCIVLEIEHDQLCLCAFGRGGALCEDELHIPIPHFVGRQYEYSSYIAYDHPHYMEDNFEIEFDLIVNNVSLESNVLLYMGNTGSYDGRRDFMAVGLYLGHVVFRFDLGSGFGQLFSADTLDMSLSQHKVRLGRSKQNGWLQVEGRRNITGRSPGLLTALNTNTKLFVGSIEPSEIEILSDDSFFKDGLNGCIFNLKIKNRDTEFLPPGTPPGHVSEGRNVGQCSSLSCDKEPCQNGGQCIDIGASVYCNCTDEWKGTFCTDSITICDLSHACATGSSCLPVGDDKYKCICPLGRNGEQCDQDIRISDAKFTSEHSFMAFAAVFVKRRMELRLQLNPEYMDGLLFYSAQRLHSTSGDFMSLTLHRSYVVFSFNMGTGTNVVRRNVALTHGTWYTVEAGRNVTHGYVTVDNETVVELVNGTMSFMDITTHFYIGSLPNLADAAPDAFIGEPVPYIGCIRELVVNGHEYLVSEEGAVHGAAIGDCDDTACGYKVCNSGNCTVLPNSTFACACPPDYAGERCDVPVACVNHSCGNGQCVVEQSNVYKCDCNIGWTGDLCDNEEVINDAIRFNEHGFVSILDGRQENDSINKSLTTISFEIRYQQLNGLVFWNGETTSNDEDYLGVGLKDGRIKLVWSLGWYTRDSITTSLKYNDNVWHNVSIQRNGQMLTMTVDDAIYESRVSGDFYQLDTAGIYKFGEFNKDSRVGSTLEHFTGSFTGCLRRLIINTRTIDFSEAEDGRNIVACDSND